MQIPNNRLSVHLHLDNSEYLLNVDLTGYRGYITSGTLPKLCVSLGNIVEETINQHFSEQVISDPNTTD